MAGKPAMPTAKIAAGEALYRLHGAQHGAQWYGRRDASWRWDDPARAYGVLYLGRTRVGAFAEALLRAPHDRDILWDRVLQKRMASFVTVRQLRLAKLHGEGLGWFQTTAAAIGADPPSQASPPGAPHGYGRAQAISAQVHAESTLDGIQYRSRLDNDELCLALFDRAGDAIALKSQDEPIEKEWVKETLNPRGYRLVDL